MQPFDTIRAQILARRAIFARQGFVVATWRTRGGARFGPYYQLAYREAGRQRAIYLGRSAELADQVRALLAELQQPLRYGRLLDRLAAEARAGLRRANAELNRVLGTFGFYLKGRHEFRRLRGVGAVASPARQMVDAWILHSRSAFRVEKSQLAEQRAEKSGQGTVESGQPAVAGGQRGGTTKDTKDTKRACPLTPGPYSPTPDPFRVFRGGPLDLSAFSSGCSPWLRGERKRNRGRSGPWTVKCKSERKCRETPHRRLGASSCRANGAAGASPGHAGSGLVKQSKLGLYQSEKLAKRGFRFDRFHAMQTVV
ncbi:MAG: hypothetical protein ACYC35_16120 [Pirellulales bacterium]